MQGLVIISTATIACLLLGFSPIVRAWLGAVFARPQPAILLFIAVMTTMLGTGEAIDMRQFQSHLPNIWRIIRFITYSGMFAVAVLSIINDSKCWKMAGTAMHLTFCYALLAVLSTAYSISPVITLWKSFEVLTLVLVAISISGHLRTSKDVRWLLDTTSIIALFMLMTVLMGIIFFPEQALRYVDPLTGKGHFGARGLVPVMNPATQGGFATILSLSILAPLLGRHIKAARDKFDIRILFVLVLAIIQLLLSRGRTQMLAFSIAVIAIMIFTKRRIAAVTLAVGGTFAILSSELALKFIYRGQNAEQFATFTGRTTGWEYVIEAAFDAPILGHGLYAAQRLMFGSGSVDNTYLEAFLGLGFVGLTILLLHVITNSLTLWRTRPRKTGFSERDVIWVQAMSIFGALVIRSIGSPTFASTHPMLVYLLITYLSAAALLRFDKEGYAEKEYNSAPELMDSVKPTNKSLGLLQHQRAGDILGKRRKE